MTTEPDQTTITLVDQVKPGWKTTEFYLSVAAKILGVLFAAGILGSGTTAERLAGIAATVLSSLGYTVSRGLVKSGAK